MPFDDAPDAGNRPLSILQIGTQFDLGGIPRHMIDLADLLRGKGHTVTLSGNSGTWCNDTTDPTFLELPIRYVAAEGGTIPARLGHLATSVFRLRSWLRSNPVDIIHTHESAPALVAMLAQPRRKIPIAISYHGAEPWRITTFSRIAKWCDVVFAPSEGSGRELTKVGGIPTEKLRAIHLGIVDPPEDDPRVVEDLRSELLGDGKRLVVMVGRLATQKGIDVLIDCVAQLKESHPEYRFALVGDGPLKGQYLDLAHNKGVLSHLNFVGRSEHVHRYFRAADLSLLTSRWEALGIVIVESFQVGTPAVVTACTGVDEVVDANSGLIAPIGDVDQICEAVVTMLSDEDALRRRSKAALAVAQEARFKPETMLQSYLDVYYSLLEKTR